MAEENKQAEESAEVEEVEQVEAEQIDWKAEARKWENRAKKNSEAAAELDALKKAQMSETERLQAELEAAKAANAAYEAEQQRAQDAREVAKATGVPESLLSYCADRDAMEQFAAEYAAKQPEIHSAPSAPSVRLVRDGSAKVSSRDQFAAFMEQTRKG